MPGQRRLSAKQRYARGVTALDVAGSPRPNLFLACTVSFHETPGASLTVTPVVPAETFTATGLWPLAEAVIWYPVTALPPLSAGAFQWTVADLTPALATTLPGAAGVLAL